MNHDFLFLTRDYESFSQPTLNRFKLSNDATRSITEKLEEIKRKSKQMMHFGLKREHMVEEKDSKVEYDLILKTEKEATLIRLENKCYTSTPFVDSINQDNLETSSDKKCKVKVTMISTSDNHEMQPLKMGSCRRYIRKMRPPGKSSKEIKLFNPNNLLSEEDLQAEIKLRETTKVNMKKPFVITKVPREPQPEEPVVTLLIEE